MARTPLAARIKIDPSFSDGYESNHSFSDEFGHSLNLAEFRSPIDLTSRIPTHIRFAESEPNQLAAIPVANTDSDLQIRQMVTMQNIKV